MPCSSLALAAQKSDRVRNITRTQTATNASNVILGFVRAVIWFTLATNAVEHIAFIASLVNFAKAMHSYLIHKQSSANAVAT